MTPSDMARLYAAAFPNSRPWSAKEVTDLIRPPGFVVSRADGFAIGRSIVGEAELITIAVDPATRRKGAGRALLTAFEAASNAEHLFLDVAADNAPALALYRSAGWVETGRRKAYYTRSGQPAVDAITMAKHRLAD